MSLAVIFLVGIYCLVMCLCSLHVQWFTLLAAVEKRSENVLKPGQPHLIVVAPGNNIIRTFKCVSTGPQTSYRDGFESCIVTIHGGH